MRIEGEDEFSAALESAINGAEDEGGDEPFVAQGRDQARDDGRGREDQGGGDIDDQPDLSSTSAREIEAKLASYDQAKNQWAAYYHEKDADLKEAQEAHRKARLSTLSSTGTDDEALVAAEEAALQAVLDARAEVDRARNNYHDLDRQRAMLAEQAPRDTPARQAWTAAHPEYRNDQRFAAEADRIMDRLRNSGMDQSHPAFYRALDTEMRTTPRMGQNSRRTPGAPAIRTDSRTGTGSGEAMTRAEAKFIRALGRDPADKTVAAQWLNSKANTKRIAQARGGFR